MNAYYNENDPAAATWLRELIREGHITDGEVDERSIEQVGVEDLRGFTRCHFFAGIGGWDHALNLARWGDRPVWTGSCPCQPFSVAGQKAGTNDVRHLWPVWSRLISESEPPVVFGEQVEAAIGDDWLDLVSTDLERAGYAVGSAVLPAAGVGAPHGRHRLWFVAYHASTGLPLWARETHEQPGTQQRLRDARDVADAERRAAERHRLELAGETYRLPAEAREQRLRPDAGHGGNAVGQADSHEARCSLERSSGLLDGQRTARGNDADGCGENGVAQGDANDTRPQGRLGVPERTGERATRQASVAGAWSDAIWHPCRDGKLRPIPTEPAFFPLAARIPGRVVRLRGYGNAIVPQVAAAFIEALWVAEGKR